MLLLFLLAWGCARDDPLLVEGQQHFHNREYQAAIEVLQRAVQGPSPSQAVYRYLGRCYLQVGQYEQARETARAGLALALDEEDPLSHARLGMILLKQQRYAAARASLLRAATLDSSLREAAYGLGLAAARTGDLAGAVAQFDEAARAYARAVELDPTNERAHLYLSDAYQQLGHRQKSRAHRVKARQLAHEAR